MKKKWLSLLLALTLAVGLLIIPAQADGNEIAGSGELVEKTATFTVKADTPTFLTNGEAYVTFHIYVKSNDGEPIRAFSFKLDPPTGLTLADTLYDASTNKDFYYKYPTADLIWHEATRPNAPYHQFAYTPGSKYLGAAGTEAGQGITKKSDLGEEVLTIVGKVAAAGNYTLSLVNSGKDVVVAGNAGTLNNTANQFKRVIVPAEVTVKGGGAISGVVKDASGTAQSGAAVTLYSGTTKKGETTTDSSGAYSFPAVENGTYTVKAANSSGTLNGSVSVIVDSADVTAGAITIQQYQKGDVNMDGSVDVNDANIMLQSFAGNRTLTNEQLELCDVTGDGNRDINDANRILQALAGNATLNT